MDLVRKISKCAVIGANGFLGKAIVHNLLQEGYKVYAVFHQNACELADGCIKVSVSDFMKNEPDVDAVFFSAGNFTSDHRNLIELNCGLLGALVEKYAAKRIIYISSTSVYGFHDTVIHENSAFNNPGLYGRAKLAGEFVVSGAADFAIMRLAYLYGKGLNNGSFLPNILSQAQTTGKIIIYGQGRREQDYLHVSDAASLCIKAMNCGFNDIFLGATGKSYSNLQVAKAIAACIPGCNIEFTGEDAGSSFYFDSMVTIRKLGWVPAVELAGGIKCMIN